MTSLVRQMDRAGVASVAVGVVLIAAGCQPPPSIAPAPDGPAVAAVSQTPRRLRRLSNREYDNVVRDLLGDTTGPARGFLADALVTGYDNGPGNVVVQSDQVEAYQRSAEALAATAVAERRDLLLGGCDPAVAGDAACVGAFFTSFATRAFRRPLTPTEEGRLRSVYEVGAAASGFALGIQMALEAILQSPQFLYREELGAPAEPGRVKLTPHELAAELSFLVTGSLPDEVLWRSVQEGRFVATGDFRREAARLLTTAAARDNLGWFFHEWFATNRLVPTMTVKDTAVYPRWDRALLTSMAGELDRLFAAVTFGDTGSLRALFTTGDAFVDPALAGIYGVSPPQSGYVPVALDPAIRPGILSRAGFLAVHSDSDSSGPVARGVFTMAAILCYPPLPRPATVPPAPSVGDTVKAGETTRQRFSRHATESACKTCHQIIDGIGFGFEAFDGIGVHRTTENGNPIDASGTLLRTGDPNTDGPFEGVPGLIERMLASGSLADCFVRQLFRFAMGHVEGAADEPILDALGADFSIDRRMTDLLVALVSSPVFTDRVSAGAAP